MKHNDDTVVWIAQSFPKLQMSAKSNSFLVGENRTILLVASDRNALMQQTKQKFGTVDSIKQHTFAFPNRKYLNVYALEYSDKCLYLVLLTTTPAAQQAIAIPFPEDSMKNEIHCNAREIQTVMFKEYGKPNLVKVFFCGESHVHVFNLFKLDQSVGKKYGLTLDQNGIWGTMYVDESAIRIIDWLRNLGNYDVEVRISDKIPSPLRDFVRSALTKKGYKTNDGGLNFLWSRKSTLLEPHRRDKQNPKQNA